MSGGGNYEKAVDLVLLPRRIFNFFSAQTAFMISLVKLIIQRADISYY